MSTKVSHSNDLCNTPKKRVSNSDSLDTLAQLVTRPENEPLEIVRSTKITDRQTLLKRARRKYLSSHLSVQLTEHAKFINSVLEKSYRNSIYCCKTLTSNPDGSITGNYCKTRWCLICNSIRTAQHIIAYSPIISSWHDPHFVTLTEKNCKGSDLSERITAMTKIFVQIKNKNRQRIFRNTSVKPLVGIRKLECTYNYRTDEYNPHFHLIVNSRQTAEFIHNEWLNRNSLAGIKGQDVRKADLNSCMELFKYMTKILVKTSGSLDAKTLIHSPSLDIIFNAMRRRRTIQTFGFKKTPVADVLDENDPCLTDKIDRLTVDIYEWEQGVTDWVNVDTGELLTGYSPPQALEQIVNNKIVIQNKNS